jgi:exodeoxyribonuclease VII large subunit
MEITGLGRIGVYEPRGAYQIILEHMDPKGVGALQAAFDQLRKKLATEGLFDDAYKKPLPALPKRIALITSPTGAVIRDMLTIIERRFPDVHILVAPVRVQGEGAAADIVGALDLVDKAGVDVAVLARGGGSLEDLAPFNAEATARAVFAARTPIISAVGHETDYTICDFAADLRAPTPSAAAERIVPEKQALFAYLSEQEAALFRLVHRRLAAWKQAVDGLTKRLAAPRKRLTTRRIRVDELEFRLHRNIHNHFRRNRERLFRIITQLRTGGMIKRLPRLRERRDAAEHSLKRRMRRLLKEKEAQLALRTARLNGQNPRLILKRGYSITRRLPEGDIVKEAQAVSVDQEVSVQLARGRLVCRVITADRPAGGPDDAPVEKTDRFTPQTPPERKPE